MATPPKLNIPDSGSTVNVSIINTNHTLRGIPVGMFIEPQLPGHDYLAAPVYAFLIQHPTLNRSLLFDLGIKKDYWNWPKPLYERLVEKTGITPSVPKHVREILDENGVDTKSLEAVVWSHWHFDHTGDPSTFDPSTALIVGPGCKEKIFPGYPANPEAAFLETDYAGREVRELDFSPGGLKIGRFPAIDYFGDGSFYFLDSPGHAIGHVCGLARVTSNPDSFIVMGGDAVHHGGELRPHQWHPLPESISPHPFSPLSASPCPGELFEPVLRDGKTEPIYLPSKQGVHHDTPLTIETIRKLQETDAHDNIFVVAAHDASLLGVVDFFPKRANDFREKGWVHKTRWAFLADFAKAVGYEGEIEGLGDWGPAPTDK